ncbi:MAG: hypothetical protein WDW36_004259 [Sanguina aurantia]
MTVESRARQLLKCLLQLEVLLRLCVGAYMFFAPSYWLHRAHGIVMPPSVALELYRQYGAATLIAGGSLHSALWSRNTNTMSLVLQCFVVGDIFAAVTIYQMYLQEGHAFSEYNACRLAACAVFALCRLAWFAFYRGDLRASRAASGELQRSLASMEDMLSTNESARLSLDQALWDHCTESGLSRISEGKEE